MVKWRGGPSDEAARQAIEAALGDVDQKMSTWRDDSELQEVRRGPGPVRSKRTVGSWQPESSKEVKSGKAA